MFHSFISFALLEDFIAHCEGKNYIHCVTLRREGKRQGKAGWFYTKKIADSAAKETVGGRSGARKARKIITKKWPSFSFWPSSLDNLFQKVGESNCQINM